MENLLVLYKSKTLATSPQEIFATLDRVITQKTAEIFQSENNLNLLKQQHIFAIGILYSKRKELQEAEGMKPFMRDFRSKYLMEKHGLSQSQSYGYMQIIEMLLQHNQLPLLLQEKQMIALLLRICSLDLKTQKKYLRSLEKGKVVKLSEIEDLISLQKEQVDQTPLPKLKPFMHTSHKGIEVQAKFNKNEFTIRCKNNATLLKKLYTLSTSLSDDQDLDALIQFAKQRGMID